MLCRGGGGGGGGDYHNHDDNNHSDNNHNNDERRNSRFLAISSLRCTRTVFNLYSQMALAQSCANHVQHRRLSCARCRVPRCTKGQLSYEV